MTIRRPCPPAPGRWRLRRPVRPLFRSLAQRRGLRDYLQGLLPHSADVHYGRAERVRAQRADVLTAAYATHPERFVRKPPEPPALPTAVWINEPKEDAATTQ
jgi:hypothetical protein